MGGKNCCLAFGTLFYLDDGHFLRQMKGIDWYRGPEGDSIFLGPAVGHPPETPCVPRKFYFVPESLRLTAVWRQAQALADREQDWKYLKEREEQEKKNLQIEALRRKIASLS